MSPPCRWRVVSSSWRWRRIDYVHARTGERSRDPIDNTYNAHHLLVLEGLEAVRKRPGMYIGSTDTPRPDALPVGDHRQRRSTRPSAGTAHRVEVTLHADGSVEVHDDGRGIPVDKEPKTGLSGVEVVFTKLHAGGKFGGGSYVATGGLHGVGASVVNALSARLDVDVDRSPATSRAMTFQRGVPGVFAGDGPDASLHAAVGADPQGQAGQRRASPAPGSGSGRTGRSSPRTRRSTFDELVSPGPPDLVHRARPRAGDPRPARRRAGRGEVPPRRRHRRVLRVPGARRAGHRHRCGCRAATRSPRPCRCSTTRGT